MPMLCNVWKRPQFTAQLTATKKGNRAGRRLWAQRVSPCRTAAAATCERRSSMTINAAMGRKRRREFRRFAMCPSPRCYLMPQRGKF